MSSEESRKISDQDLQMVQNLIEQCLQRYMTLKEVVNILSVQEKIEPGFTELVWQKLEQENQEFFKAYHLRLMLKEQIMEFNRLLGRQVEMMHHVDTAGVSFLPANGSHMPPMSDGLVVVVFFVWCALNVGFVRLLLWKIFSYVDFGFFLQQEVHQNSACYAPENMGPALKTENMQQPIATNIPNDFTNCGVSIPSCMQTAVDMPAHSRRIDIPHNMLLAQSSNVGMTQGMNVGMIKTEAGYPSMSQFIYGSDGNVMETRPAIGDASISSFSSVESTSQPLNETLMDADTSSFELLGISQNFGLSDLTAEFSHDILENYSRPPFLGRDSGDFLDSYGRGDNQGDTRRLNTISEGLSYEDFCSD